MASASHQGRFNQVRNMNIYLRAAVKLSKDEGHVVTEVTTSKLCHQWGGWDSFSVKPPRMTTGSRRLDSSSESMSVKRLCSHISNLPQRSSSNCSHVLKQPESLDTVQRSFRIHVGLTQRPSFTSPSSSYYPNIILIFIKKQATSDV